MARKKTIKKNNIKKRKYYIKGKIKRKKDNSSVLRKKTSVRYTPKSLRGMPDILPEDIPYWKYFLDRAENLARIYGIKKIIPPILEEAQLYVKTTGIDTDIVQKQMYTFNDLSGTKIALRPEFTPGIARIYIQNGMFNLVQPVKFYYYGPCFRYERPQTGRYRQFNQFGVEVIGSADPIVDAQIITFTNQLFNKLGLKIKIQINSLGCPECRKIYRKELIKYFRSRKKLLPPEYRDKITTNPLRILDSKDPDCQNIIKEAPSISDSLCEDCNKHFTEVLEFLDAADITYEINPRLVRGLDYYTRTVFEIFPDRENDKDLSSQSALGGGGRYDTLIRGLGGRSTPAAGFSYGIERIIQEMKIQKIKVPKLYQPKVFLMQLGKKAKQRALKLSEDLRREGFKLAENFSKNSLRVQLEIANKMNVKFALILGQEEVLNKTIIIRDMNSGNQEIIDQTKLVKELKRRLK